MIFAYVAAFATAIFYGISAVIEDAAAKRVPISGASGKRAALRAAGSRVYILGMALSVVAWAASLVALHTLPLFAVQSIAASSMRMTQPAGVRYISYPSRQPSSGKPGTPGKAADAGLPGPLGGIATAAARLAAREAQVLLATGSGSDERR